MRAGMSSALLAGTFPPSLFYVGGFTTGSDLTTYTFGSTPLGSKDANGRRWTVVCVGSYSDSVNRTVTAVTVGGSPATIVVFSPGDLPTCAIAIIDTSAMADTVSVTFTLSSGGVAAAMIVYRMFDIISSTPFSTATSGATSGLATLTTDINTPGCTVAVAMCRNGGTYVWSGLAEDLDTDIDSNDQFSVASGGAVGFPSVITAQNSVTSVPQMRAIVATWR